MELVILIRSTKIWLSMLLPLLYISMKYFCIWKVSNNNAVVWPGLRPGKRFSKFVDCCAWFDWPLLDENCLKLGDNPSIWVNCSPFWSKVDIKKCETTILQVFIIQIIKCLQPKSPHFFVANHHQHFIIESDILCNV